MRFGFCLTVMAGMVLTMNASGAASPHAGPATVAHFRFDAGERLVIEQRSGQRLAIEGLVSQTQGPTGAALLLDGYTTGVSGDAIQQLQSGGGWSISCWLKLEAFPWNEAPILDQATSAGSLFFGVDPWGRLLISRASQGRAERIRSREAIPVRTWTLVTASFSGGRTTFFAGDKQLNSVAAEAAQGAIDPKRAASSPLLIGRARAPRLPFPPDKIHPLLPAEYGLEGALADLTIHERALGARQLKQLTAGVDARWLQATPPPPLPRWDGGAGPFGAFYTTLNYDSPTWHRGRRVGPDSDVVVRFAHAPVQLVFWQGMNFIPAWVTENNRWYTEQFMEIYGKPRCPDGEDCEPMSDKQSRYSHVRILESTPARVVIHWRYALAEVENHKLADATSPMDWGAWADEYWTVYPDAVAVRRQVLWTDAPNREASEFHETIVLVPAGERPEDVIHLDALSLGNLQGQTATYTWVPRTATDFAKPRGPDNFPAPADPVIQRVNLKSQWKPFQITGAQPAKITGINWEPSMSTFEWWNHWPVAQIRSSGRPALLADRPGHSSLSHIKWPITERDEQRIGRLLLTGLTTKTADALAPRARSWLQPALAQASSGQVRYDQAQRSYVVENAAQNAPLRITIHASEEQPLVNPAVMVSGWPHSASVTFEGAQLDSGASTAVGYVDHLASRDLIAYLPLTATQTLTLSIVPQPH